MSAPVLIGDPAAKQTAPQWRELLVQVYDRFREGFDPAELIAAKALLDGLKPSPSPSRERGPTLQKLGG